jgi:Fe-S-cluster containining protein
MHAYVPCEAHDQDAKTCMIYEERPEICRTFPVSPDQIEGSPCSHWFESEDGAVKRGGGQSPYPTEPEF